MAGLSAEALRTIGWSIVIGSCYIAVSAALISFNKYLMHPGRFPHSLALGTMHMFATTLLSQIFCRAVPSWYPSLPAARENMGQVLKCMIPLACCFGLAIYCSNEAYFYCSVAFLQFCKEGNVALVFGLSCLIGLHTYSMKKAITLMFLVAGCSICIHGEMHFVMIGLAFQLTSQFAEVVKNVMADVIMSGAGLKLDALTFVSFQAPCSLIPLAAAFYWTFDPVIAQDFVRMWPLLLANAVLAFGLNVMVAVVIKQLTAVAFVIIGLAKDMIIIVISSWVLGEPVTRQQWTGFAITLAAIAVWSDIKLKEQHDAKLKETQPILIKENAERKAESA
eukprot:TRINITY_DN2228_c1_g1_i1.p1 TRINITY_DN2228_c1_g1~~TRINITY_DN2228_c1_g1_i1.p1  ORF type:complete len:335 (-),score=59.11 TRINITY_DN2228_c1_g1_i1:263-1267(-)